MIKSSRLAPVVAGLVIWGLLSSQLALSTPRAAQSVESQKADSSDKSKVGVKKSKKKRKKKKNQAEVPTIPSSIFAGSHIFSMPNASSVPIPTTIAVPLAQPRATTHATRTPIVHVNPIQSKNLAPLSFSGSNSGPIEIGSENPDSEPIPAVPYSSDITVPGLAGNVTSVSVTINGLIHDSPDDLDMLLVSPDNRAFHFWSDVGGTSVANGITVNVADTGSSVLPDDGPLVSGETYRPFNNDTVGDEFPLPAIGPPYAEPTLAGGATFTSVFGGMPGDFAGGDWHLFVTDDQNGNGGSISGGWSLNITTQVPATTAGQLIISEFRTNGPLGSTDEFIELYNTSGAPLLVQASEDSPGLGVVTSDQILRCIVPNGTSIPKNGHFLCNHSAGGGSAPSIAQGGVGDAFLNGDLPDNTGIALFNNASENVADRTLANRLDAAGPSALEDTLFKEGNGYPGLDLSGLDHSFFRDLSQSGNPKDTGDNAADFVFVDTAATPTTAGRRLGAPSPEGLSDPRTTNEAMVVTLFAPCFAATESPNRVRDLTPDPTNNSSFGTMTIRRAFTNITANEITRLRFKVIEITTLPVPEGTADLRLRSSTSSSQSDPCSEGNTINLTGVTLDQPPTQLLGGGLNSNASPDTIQLPGPIQPGETVFIEFLLGVQQTGRFRFFVNIESLP